MQSRLFFSVVVLLMVALVGCGGRQAPPPEPQADADSAARARADSIARADSLRRARERAEAAAELCEQARQAMADGEYSEARELYRRAANDFPESECAGQAETVLSRIDRIEAVRARIHFEFDRSRITDEAAEVLRRKAEVLREHPGVRLVIEGHCDERGSNEYNMALGQRRANSAHQHLLELGVPEEAIVRTVSYGEERPLVNRSTEQAWAQNRRADFTIQEMGDL